MIENKKENIGLIDRDGVWREKKQMLENDLAKVWIENKVLRKLNDDLNATIEDLRCCANCKLYISKYCPSREVLDESIGLTEYKECNHVCTQWTTDKMTKVKRME